MFKIPELLAPAGGMEQLRAAVENGADAVYMGGKLFNARINAKNFDDDEIRQAVEYAHLRGVKIYVTMNTLIKDSELEEALNYAAALYHFGADALIVQDLGFARLVKECLPDLDMHLSTQGTVYNIEGIRQAKALGFSRAVLARELTLEEIREITQANIIDIEVFAHGALCICYSGQCQMSREIGGRSGNRGACAQPCRLPYSICKAKNGGFDEIFTPTFALSPKDLRTIECLDLLIQAGITSLKIEGRMKSAEYVAVVTKIYRKYLDVYAETGKVLAKKEDLEELSQIFNRGNFTTGYLFGDPEEKLMSGKLSKHQGIYLGKVLSYAAPKKKEKHQLGLVDLKLEKNLSVGDGIEIRNRELSGNIVTFLKRKGQKIEEAKSGEIATVGYIDGAIRPGDDVYKISDKGQLKRARESFEGKSSLAEKELKKIQVRFQFEACYGRPAVLKGWDDDGNSAVKESFDTVEKAINRPLTKETVADQLNKTGGTPFKVKECWVQMEEDISMPLSKINELRRVVLEELEAKRKQGRSKVELNDWKIKELAVSKLNYEDPSENAIQNKEYTFRYYFQATQGSFYDQESDRAYIPYDALLDSGRNGSNVVPVIPPVTKGWHDGNIRRNFSRIVELSEENGISVGNLGWIEPFAAKGVRVYGDYGLNIYNSMDFFIARELGLKEAVISHEAALEDILEMDFYGILPEIAMGGRIPLMISEHDFIGQAGKGSFFLKDRKGELYPILTHTMSRQSIIFSHKNSSLNMQKNLLQSKGIQRFRYYIL